MEQRREEVEREWPSDAVAHGEAQRPEGKRLGVEPRADEWLAIEEGRVGARQSERRRRCEPHQPPGAEEAAREIDKAAEPQRRAGGGEDEGGGPDAEAGNQRRGEAGEDGEA